MRKFLHAIGGIFIAVFAFCIVTLVLASTHGNTFSQEIVSWFDKKEEETEIDPDIETTSALLLNASANDAYTKMYLTDLSYLTDFSYETTTVDDLTSYATLKATLPSSFYKVRAVTLSTYGGVKSFSQTGTELTIVTNNYNTGLHNMNTYFELRAAQVSYTFVSRVGYDLTGVYTDVGLQSAYTGNGTLCAALYPGYTMKTYTVEFNSNGAASIDNQTVNYGASVTLPEVERDGFVFGGWYDEDGHKYTGAAIYDDLVLTAKWSPSVLTVKIYDAQNKLLTTVEVDYGTTVADALTQAGMKYNVVTKATTLADEELDLLRSGDKLTDDVKLTVRDGTGLDKVDTFVTSYWYLFVAIAVLAIIIILVAITQKKRGRR